MVSWEISSAQVAVGPPCKMKGVDVKWVMLLWEINISLSTKAVKSWP